MGTIRELERQGQESVQQAEIVDSVTQKVVMDEGQGTSVERAKDTAKKIANVINHLINKEDVLMVTQEAKVKNERLLCMNINVDLAKMDLSGQ